jgi:hypothetical protein
MYCNLIHNLKNPPGGGDSSRLIMANKLNIGIGIFLKIEDCDGRGGGSFYIQVNMAHVYGHHKLAISITVLFFISHYNTSSILYNIKLNYYETECLVITEHDYRQN